MKKFEVNIFKQISLSLRVWRWRLSKVDKDKVNKVDKVDKVDKVNKVDKENKLAPKTSLGSC